MKIAAIGILSIAVYAILLKYIDGLLPWIATGIFFGIGLSIWSSILYNRAHAREQALIDEEGLDIDASAVIGEKSNSTVLLIILGLVLGFISYGIDIFFTTLF